MSVCMDLSRLYSMDQSILLTRLSNEKKQQQDSSNTGIKKIIVCFF
jgi:hypothetical protein